MPLSDPLSHVDRLEALPWPRPGRWKVRGRDLVYASRSRGIRLEVTPRGAQCRVKLVCDLTHLERLVRALASIEPPRSVPRAAPGRAEACVPVGAGVGQRAW